VCIYKPILSVAGRRQRKCSTRREP